jgi:hypothetical protein
MIGRLRNIYSQLGFNTATIRSAIIGVDNYVRPAFVQEILLGDLSEANRYQALQLTGPMGNYVRQFLAGLDQSVELRTRLVELYISINGAINRLRIVHG